MGKNQASEQNKNCFLILKTSITNLFQHPEILKPFIILLFIQLFILQLLYFIPRFPFNIVFGPLITKIWSGSFMHYPFNFALLPKLFQHTQPWVYNLISSVLIATSIAAIININNGEKTNFKKAFKQASKYYIHIVLAAFLVFVLIIVFFQIFALLYDRAQEIRSTTGKFFILKYIILAGAPYFNLFFSVLATTLLGYVIPIILVDKKKILPAIWINFKVVFKSFWSTFFIVLLPSLLFIPILILRNSLALENVLPELSVLMLVLTIIVLVLIDAIVYTALTTFYLLRKDT